MKVRAKKLPTKLRIETLDILYTAAGTVRSRAQMKLFLRDLLTESERIMLGRRIQIARLLISGETHRSIEKRMGVGKDTVWRVQRWLNDQFPGYEQVLTQLEKEFQKREFKKNYAKSSLFRLKKKYPLYYLLLPLPKNK